MFLLVLRILARGGKQKWLKYLEQTQPLGVVPDRALVQRAVDRRERGPVDARGRELILAALPARVEVVDGQDDAREGRGRERRPGPWRRVQVPVEHRRGTGLPVVDVEDGGAWVEAPPDEPGEGLEGCSGKEEVADFF